jgi:ribonucleoside-triphosphate reductase (formate)
VVNFFYTLQGEAAGAQAFSNFDTLLAPFIRHDQLGYKEVKQALQEFVFNLNVATRVGFQTPFTNLTMDLQPPKSLANQPVILIGGEMQNTKYGDYAAEMLTLNSAFLEVLSEGDAKGRVFSFPIPTYNITPDFNWDAPGLDKLWEVTARYGIPYFANFVNSDMKADDARSMCCRLRLDKRAHMLTEKEKRGLEAAACSAPIR